MVGLVSLSEATGTLTIWWDLDPFVIYEQGYCGNLRQTTSYVPDWSYKDVRKHPLTGGNGTFPRINGVT